MTGVPLLYIIRVALVPEDDDDDPACGDEDSKYISIDMEMIARAPILSDEADIGDEDNTSRNTQTSRMDARRGVPSMIISLGGTR